jgi:hypothetical protein
MICGTRIRVPIVVDDRRRGSSSMRVRDIVLLEAMPTLVGCVPKLQTHLGLVELPLEVRPDLDE